jgi:hypothetical protein
MSSKSNTGAGDAGGAFRFRVSDSLEVPLRGHLLRLRRLEGHPSMKDLKAGRRIRLQSPAGVAREVTILSHSETGGRATQRRLDRIGELDVIISRADAGEGENRIGIGWTAGGPVA